MSTFHTVLTALAFCAIVGVNFTYLRDCFQKHTLDVWNKEGYFVGGLVHAVGFSFAIAATKYFHDQEMFVPFIVVFNFWFCLLATIHFVRFMFYTRN